MNDFCWNRYGKQSLFEEEAQRCIQRWSKEVPISSSKKANETAHRIILHQDNHKTQIIARYVAAEHTHRVKIKVSQGLCKITNLYILKIFLIEAQTEKKYTIEAQASYEECELVHTHLKLTPLNILSHSR